MNVAIRAAWLVIAMAAAPLALADIKVFTTSYLPLSNDQRPNVQVYQLDGPEQALASLSQGLPNTLEEAKREALTRINTVEGRRLMGDVRRAYDAVIQAWALRVRKLPAVVIDERYVVYGVYDVLDAEQRVAAYRGAR